MSVKPKVYQGVRVNKPVRELLQQKRALQAEKKATELQACRMQFSDPSHACSEIYNDCDPTPSLSNNHSRQFPNYINQEESLSFEDQLRLLDAFLPADSLADANFNFWHNASPCTVEDNIHTAPIFQQRMATELPLDFDMSNSFQSSPTSQGLPFSPSEYRSYQDPKNCAFANTDSYFQHQNNGPYCFCLYCCSMEYQEAVKAMEPYSYSNTNCMDYLPSSTVSEDFFGREINSYDYEMFYR